MSDKEMHVDKKSKSTFYANRYNIALPADYVGEIQLPDGAFTLYNEHDAAKPVKTIQINNGDIFTLLVLKGLEAPKDLKDGLLKTFNGAISKILR